ncbi:MULTISPECIES: TadE/TadG family type IV pilus assembly protein [unclassified Gilliamella]|uniref:TadE/TadG family type IV pilus assembly protein n=1 Tax=unclassified Gilliamella TaxID=2685620 RepID=UPI00080E3E06|nr:TadE family protein [Gilliamella apicola]OCG22548.1 hypothetical protein A9G23_02625 [Gilliamella apicola]OCG23697.1 hypothetical protein A9G22_05610 [Gilliamella apicola]
MLKCWKLFFRKNNANVSIEFAIVFPYLIVLFVFVLELSRIMFIGSALDLMSTEITRKTAISENGNYTKQMQQLVISEVPLWPYLTNPDDFHVTVAYCQTIQDVINKTCQNTLNADTRLLLFNLQYDYYAMFSGPFSRILNSSLTKKTVIYREFYDN